MIGLIWFENGIYDSIAVSFNCHIMKLCNPCHEKKKKKQAWTCLNIGDGFLGIHVNFKCYKELERNGSQFFCLTSWISNMKNNFLIYLKLLKKMYN